VQRIPRLTTQMTGVVGRRYWRAAVFSGGFRSTRTGGLRAPTAMAMAMAMAMMNSLQLAGA
jgi:hypothetical protein